jgi:hypothetical protein
VEPRKEEDSQIIACLLLLDADTENWRLKYEVKVSA